MAAMRLRDGWDRWACLAAAMIIEACGGLGYTFAVYSQHLKERLDYDQEDLDGIGAAKDFGYCLGIVGGIFYNYIPPWLTIVVGSLLHFMGYFMVYMASAGKIVPSFFVLCGFIAVGVGGDSWIDTAAIMTSVQNFTDYRGTALGVLKAQVGICGAIFMTLYKAFLKPNVDAYIVLVALAPALTGLALAFIIRPFPSNESDTSGDGRFDMAYGATIFLGLYLLFSIIFQAWWDVTRSWLIFFAVTMVSVFFSMTLLLVFYRPAKRIFDSLIGVPLEECNAEEMVLKPSSRQKHLDINSSDDSLEEDNQPLKSEAQDSQEDSQDHQAVSLPSQMLGQKQGYHILEPQWEEASKGMQLVAKQEVPEVETAGPESYSLWQCVQSVNFMVLCLVAITGPGTGLAVINNLGQIGRSLKSENVELYVGLISVASCFGRLAGGYGSDVLLRNTTYPRPLCLSIAHLIMTFGCLSLAVGYVPLLYVGSVLVGGSYGSFWALTPAILPEVFGIQNFPALYKFIGAFGPVGAFFLSAKVVGQFYDEEAELYHAARDVDAHTCIGRKCFGYSMLVLAIVCMLGASLGAILSIRTRQLYAQMKLHSRQ
ncbi:unnamed protein product [Calypogeia fissa]